MFPNYLSSFLILILGGYHFIYLKLKHSIATKKENQNCMDRICQELSKLHGQSLSRIISN